LQKQGMRGAMPLPETGFHLYEDPGGDSDEMSPCAAIFAAPIACPGMVLRGAAARHRAAAPVLIQIKRGYRARWQDLDLSVEVDSDQWTVRVQDVTRSRTMHTAHRSSAAAARTAAAEFALFRVSGAAGLERPEALAKTLEWHEYWQ
jgi:hypothetical protein